MEDKIVHIGYEHIINKYINDGYVIKIKDGGPECDILYKANVQSKNLVISVNSSQYKEAKKYLNDIHIKIANKKSNDLFKDFIDDREMVNEDAIQYEKMFMTRANDDRQKNNKTIKKPNATKKYRTKGEMTNKIKRYIALFLATTGVVLVGAKALNEIKSDIQYTKEANTIVEEINEENSSKNIEEQKEDSIKAEIYNRIKQEVSEATGVPVEDINIVIDNSSSAGITTTIKAGDKYFSYTDDLRSPINLGNDYSHKIKDIILKTKNAENVRDLKKALKETIEFTEENDLREKGDKLKTVKNDDRDER